jgi:hypothetical protein
MPDLEKALAALTEACVGSLRALVAALRTARRQVSDKIRLP